MTDEIKAQNYVADVLHMIRNYPIPKHRHDRELAVLWANWMEEAWTREKAAMAALKMQKESRFTVRCHHCHKELVNVNLNCFRWDGSDDVFEHGISWRGINDAGEPFVEVRTCMPWTGEDLSDEERPETVTCPHCGKHPFAGGTMNSFGSVSLVMFPLKEDVEMAEGKAE